MSKHIAQPISVSLNNRNLPSTFKWRERMYRVESLQESWRTTGAWWDGEGEITYFRVKSDKGGIYELAYSHTKDAWTLETVRD